MNQILCTQNCNLRKFEPENINKKKGKSLRFQIYFLFGALTSTLGYYLYFQNDLNTQEEVAKSLMDSFEITKIYADNSDYSTERLNSEEVFFYEDSSFSVIGVIDIKKINVSYSILSDISNEFLRISPCRFYGPMPNEIRQSLYCCSQLQKQYVF